MGAKGLARAKVDADGQLDAVAAREDDHARSCARAINAQLGAKDGDLLFFQFGKRARRAHGAWRTCACTSPRSSGSSPRAGTAGKWNFLWVVNPPLFEYDDERKTWAAAHHAFTRPHDECVDLLETDPGKVLCYRYDLVLNGFEIGGGSIRLHDPEVQAKVFRALGIADEEAREKFGFLLDALRFGAPPHGGIALGMDRLAMLLSRRREPARRHPVPEDAKGHRSDDRRAERRRRRRSSPSSRFASSSHR